MSVPVCLSLFLCLIFAPSRALSHEVWIDPLAFRIDTGTDFIADTKIGENFKGSAQYYVEENTLSAGVLAPDQTLELDRISGDIPAMKATVDTEGLHVAWMHTKPSRLHYKTFDKFKNFVTEQGLSEIAQQHLDRGWPTENFFEAYSRCSKSLIQVGAVDDGNATVGKDKAIGMPIELVATANPYVLGHGQTLPVRLLWQAQPVADAQVMIFHKTAPKEVAITTVQTNAEGIASIPLQSGTYMLNAVRIIPWDGKPTAQWHSYWASMTFDIE